MVALYLNSIVDFLLSDGDVTRLTCLVQKIVFDEARCGALAVLPDCQSMYLRFLQLRDLVYLPLLIRCARRLPDLHLGAVGSS
jgi:hypothetical protein